jgi:hypothetical protein
MKTLAVATLATVACLGSVAQGQTVSSAPADAFLSWTVSPGTLENGVWIIPGTTTLTASIVDEFGNPITEGRLVWETCTVISGLAITGRPSADCEQHGPARWTVAAIVNLANPIPISPCLCAGQQLGFRLSYRGQGSGFRNTTSEPFDLLAEISCPPPEVCP